MRLRDRLYRFRPAGTPGAAGVAGVPVHVEPADELAALFDALGETEAACVARRSAAEQDAADLVDRTRREVSSRWDDIRRRAAAARVQAAVQARATVEAEISQLLAAADVRAADVGRRAAARQPELRDQVVEAVRTLLSSAPGGQA